MLRIEATEHDGGVELDDTVFVGQTAIADRMILGVGFHDRHPLDRRVERIMSGLDQVHRLFNGSQAVTTGHNDRLLVPCGLYGCGPDGQCAQARGGRRRPRS